VAEVLLFHHAHGRTQGSQTFAGELRARGHAVHVPDLYEGKTFSDLADGVAYAEGVGFDTIIERGRSAANDLSNELVYIGFSLGALPAQALAQTRPGAKGAILLGSCNPVSEFSPAWPQGVALQIHAMEGDEWMELEVARELEATIAGAELFLYPGDRHLFVDEDLPDYDEQAAALFEERVLRFLDDVG
jgi:dienelactone hydrolase